ncbi:MAG: hypothetical protein QW589_01515 [Candidatus Bathyarchaeia archaeon]
MRKEILYSLAGLTLAFFVIYVNTLFKFAEPLKKAKDYAPLEVGIKNEYSRIIELIIHEIYSLSYILIVSFIIAFLVYLISKKKLKNKEV